MKTPFQIVFLLLTTKLLSQNNFPTTGPRVDTNYYFAMEIRPQDKVYEYYYYSKYDTLKFVTWQNKKSTTVKIKVDANFKEFLISKFIHSFDNLLIDNKHRHVSQSFSVFTQIGYNFNSKYI